MLQLSFKQTSSEMMVRAAATVLFSALKRQRTPEVNIAELAEHPQYGFTASAVREPVGPRLVRITDLQDGQIVWESVPYCECSEPEKYFLQENDILFARTGATTGKTHFVRSPEPAIFASYLIRLRPRANVEAGYLYSFFQSDNYWSQISEEKEGSAQPNVNGEKLASLKIPAVQQGTQRAIADFLVCVRRRQDGDSSELPELPSPLTEQRRVVARIEDLSAKIEEARVLRKQAAVEAEALLAAESARLFEPKAGWKVMAVDEFCEPPQYGYTESATEQPIGPRFLRITDIQDGRVNWRQVPFCRCPEPNRYLLKSGDLVFARTGATTGKSFVIRDCPEAVFASYLIRLRVRDTVSVDYLYHYFQSPPYWQQVANEKEGTGQPNLNGSKLEKLKVPVAPPAEQLRIVAGLDQLQERTKALKALQTETSAELDALMPSILDKAFRGEL